MADIAMPLRFDRANDPLEDGGHAFQAKADETTLNAALRRHYRPETQMSPAQIETVSAAILSRGPKCNLLVFGLGNDSPLWVGLNSGGYTLFVEDVPQWIAKMKSVHEGLNVRHMTYPTTVGSSLENPAATIQAATTIPAFLTERAWGVIIVDGPMGYAPQFPGRALPLCWTAKLARDSTHIFVDDYERDLERGYADLLFIGRKNDRSFVIPRPATPRLNASLMLWLVGKSEAFRSVPT